MFICADLITYELQFAVERFPILTELKEAGTSHKTADNCIKQYECFKA